ncbi:MAG: ABC transporter permease subunit [Sedimentisphaerales bacterium]|nr:ABC transporter permease subunit [Sedimentisphaerales bacterium]
MSVSKAHFLILFMNSTLIDILEYINPVRLFGPIFAKELIVSSRRRRNYFVRFAYPFFLAFFVASAFTRVFGYRGQYPSVMQVSQLAQVGISITTAIVWFQFIIVQFLAVVMLSTAISDEIYSKTLGVLMTTPISSFQIVFGKLLSKLLQLLLLIAISLPLLAIIRVFGGIPWYFVISSLCITLTASIFAGTISLIFSIYNRQSHLVISRTLLVCFFIYAGPLIAFVIMREFCKDNLHLLIPKLGLFFINPFMLMRTITTAMQLPSASIPGETWLLHCAVMLGLSVIVFIWSVSCVRKAGLRQITGQAGLFLTRKERKIADKKLRQSYSSSPVSGKIRDIKWHPVIWREIANPMIKPNRITSALGILLSLAFLVTAYGLCIYYEVLGRIVTHIVFVLVYFFIALIRTSTFASMSITNEKEARSWPILLTSPLAEKEIALCKIIGSCLRAWGYWLLLAAHLVVFILAGIIKAPVFIPLVLIAISSALLVSSIGVMFSSMCKRSTTSSILNIITFLTCIIPVCCIPFLYFVSPLFAAASIFGVWGGFIEMFDSFNISPNTPLYIIKIIAASHFSFIIYTVIYLLVTYGAYQLSANHIRWRIL